MQTIYIDISRKAVLPTITAKQGDVGRKFEVVFTDSGLPYDLSGASFSVFYSGASGEGNYTHIGENSAFTVYKNTVTVEIITQMLTNPGEGTLCLVISHSSGGTIGTWNIDYSVESVPGSDSEVAQNYYTAFSDAVSNAVTATEAAIQAAERANEAAASGGPPLPGYWQGHLDVKVPIIRSAMQAVGRNKSAFLFYSDSHWDGSGNCKNSPALLKYLVRHTPITKVIFGGDIVSTESTTDSEMSYLYDSWRSAIRELPYHHSVVGNHDDGNATNNLFSPDYVYAFLLAPEESHDRVDGDGFYYYIDEPCEKTRYLYLDTAYQDAYSLSEGQARFIVGSLKTVPEGWHIVVIGHAWFDQDYSNYPAVVPSTLTGTTTKVITLLSAYNNRESGTLDAVSYDFTGAGGKVEFCIGGHLHNDYDTFESGIPVILCEADTMHNRNGSISTAGTVTEQAVTAVIADYKNGCVRLIRVGRGEDRAVSLKGVQEFAITVSATNCVGSGDNPSAIESEGTAALTFTANAGCELLDTVTVTGASYTWDKSSGTLTLSAPSGDVSVTVKAVHNVLKTVGYVENKRLSGSSGEVRDHAGTDITGFIPITMGQIQHIYLKNVTMPSDGSVSYSGTMVYYGTDQKMKQYVTLNQTSAITGTDSAGNITAVRINGETYNTSAYVRFCAVNIDDTSIITVNEPI